MTIHDIYEIDRYDKIIVSLSGGKDSIAMLLYLIEQGVAPDRIEAWHQAVDGMHDTHTSFMDWPSTEGYVRELCNHLRVRLSWQWRAFGFKGEMFRENSRSHDIFYRNDEELLVYSLPTTRGDLSTRRKWPMKTASLKFRYCSSSLKIDPARRVMSNRPDLKGSERKQIKILWLTGERRQESPARARYAQVEHHPANSKSRIVHHYRPVIDWKEEDVWTVMERHRILPHPAYHLGLPRLSCRSCIFFSPSHWASLNDIDPKVTAMLHDIEKDLNFTIDNKFSIPELIAMGRSKVNDSNRFWIPKAVSQWRDPVVTDNWQLPAGAFSGEGGGSV